MNRMDNSLNLFTICLMVLLTTVQLLAINAAHGGIYREARASRWALIAHAGPVGESAAKSLSRTLRDSYGYESAHVFLVTGRVTRERIEIAMEKIQRRIRPSDELFVHLSLPIYSNGKAVWFVTDEADVEAPWTLLELRNVVYWLSETATGQAFFTYPSCAGVERESLEHYLFDPLRYRKRGGVIEIMRVCDVEALRLARRDPGSRELLPRDERRAELLSKMSQELRRAAASPAGGVLRAEDFAERLSTGPARFDVRVERLPEHSDAVFVFAAKPSQVGQYRVEYRGAPGETLAALVSRARDEDDMFERQAVEFLRDIALDPNGLLDQGQDARAIRTLATEGLSLLGSSAARSALRIIAKQADEPWVRRVSITEMSRLTSLGTADRVTIGEALGDPDAGVREGATWAVVRIKDEQSLPLLSRLVTEDKETGVRVAAMNAIAALEGKDFRSNILRSLEDPNPEIRLGAAEALKQLVPDQVTSRALLEHAERDEAVSVRVAAAFALGETTPQAQRAKTAERLVASVRRADDRLQRAAAYSLGFLGGPEAERFLRVILAAEDRPEATRVTAAEALGRLRSVAALPELMRAAESPMPGLRRASLSVLGAVGGDGVADVVVSRLKDEDPYVRAAAQQALKALESPPIDVLIGSLESPVTDVRLEAVRKLGAAKDPAGAEALLARLGDNSNDVRVAAIDALAGYELSAIIDLIHRALEDNDPRVRAGATTVLGRYASSVVPEELWAALEDSSGVVRTEAVRALGHFENPQVQERILEATGDEDSSVRRAAVQSLQRVASDEAVAKRLREIAVSDPSTEVRESATQALGQRRIFKSR